MKLATYMSYKDSGIELLGEIPNNWKINRYRNALRIEHGAAFQSGEYVLDSDVVNVRMGNIKKGGTIDLKHNVKYLPSKYKAKYSKYILHEGDLIIAMTDISPSLDFLAVPAFVVGLEADKTYLLNQRVGRLRVSNFMDNVFLKYLLLSEELRTQLKLQGLGTVQSNMSSENLYTAYFCAPAKKEQTQIADFLDRETAKIDLLIDKQQKLIKLLEEKRQTIISNAVTKGLNPDAPMKDSGVEWIGCIPKSWEMWKLAHACRYISSGTTPKTDSDKYYGGDNLWVTTGELREGIITQTQKRITDQALIDMPTLKLHPAGSVAIAMYGATIGRLGIFGKKATTNQACCVMPPSKILHNKFLFYWLLSMKREIINLSSGGGQPNVNQEKIASLKVSSPSYQEQIQIAAFIDSQTAKIDTLQSKAKTAIKLMKERRTALISAAVTGKIDVRNTI